MGKNRKMAIESNPLLFFKSGHKRIITGQDIQEPVVCRSGNFIYFPVHNLSPP